jgi:amino acid adenylation domain-containing protein
MLVVIKAGAAFVLLGPSYPSPRLQEICTLVRSNVILCSQQHATKAQHLGSVVVSVDGEDSHDWRCHQVDQLRSTVQPSNALYAVFTSGSTGKPKGIVIQHDSFCTSALAYMKAAGLDAQMRALQFSSYGFDVSISDTLVTFLAGACICVPSDLERSSDLPGAVARMDVNFADLTPSALQWLSPADVPSIRTFALGGEAMSQTIIAKWCGQVRLRDAYGPAECCMLSTLQPNVSTIDPSNIGYATGGACWVVDKADTTKLIPIGAVGELLIEGPVVGRGYIGDPEKTAASFVEDLPWLESVRGSRKARFYKTGDLVRYRPDGSLVFIGRKDTQVKVRGQRVELGEVERHVLQNLPRGTDVSAVAEVIAPADSNRPILAVFLCLGYVARGSPYAVRQVLGVCTAQLEGALTEQLPIYMVPSAYIPVECIPLTATGKTDRKRLREMGASWRLDELAALETSASHRAGPTTEMERLLQGIWAPALNLPADRIGIHDSFFRPGGDSILAMKAAALARSRSIKLSVRGIFEHRQLRRFAEALSAAPELPCI